MIQTPLSRQRFLNGFRLINALTPLTLGVALLASAGMPAEALPVVVQSAPSGNFIYGSPIPSPVPVNPYTGQPTTVQPYSVSPYNYRGYNSPYNQYVTPGRGVIQNSTLINPTIVNPRVSNSVLVDPVIVSPRYPYGTYGYPYGSYGYSPYYYNPYYYNRSGGVRIQVGF